MKITKLFPILFVLTSVTFYGQGGRHFKEKKEQIKAMKIAFITNELWLTPDEATKFWPIFNAFDDKQNDIRIQKMKSHLNKIEDENIAKLSEKEAGILLAQIESAEDALFELRKKFVASLRGIISNVKILKLKRAEENFNKKLLQQYRDKRAR